MLKETKKDMIVIGIVSSVMGLFIIMLSIIGGIEYSIFFIGIFLLLDGVIHLLKYFNLFYKRFLGIKVNWVLVGIYFSILIAWLFKYLFMK